MSGRAWLLRSLCVVGLLCASVVASQDHPVLFQDAGWDRSDLFFTPIIAISPDGHYMALAGSRGSAGRLHIWDLSTGKRILILGDFPRVMVATFSPDGRFLLTGHSNGLVLSWNVATGAIEQRLQLEREPWVRAMAFSTNGASLALGGQSGTLYSVAYPALTESWHTKAHHYGLSDLAFTKTDSTIYTVGDDQHIYLWNARTGQPNQPSTELRREDGRLKAHTGMIKTIAIVDNDTKAISGSYWEGGNVKSYTSVAPPDEIIRMWDLRSGKVLKSLQLNWGIRCCIQEISPRRQVAFVNTSGWAELDGVEPLTLQVLDFETGKIVRSLTDTSPITDPYLHGIQHFRVVPHSDLIVVGLRSGVFLLWNVVSNTVAASFVSRDDWWAIATPAGMFDVSNINRLSSEPVLGFLKAPNYQHSPGLLNHVLVEGKR